MDEAGFSAAIPADWTIARDGLDSDFLDGDRFLRIDQTQTPRPDPVDDWENQETTVSACLGGYLRIKMEPLRYRDYDAADWEFTWQADNGALHVLNRKHHHRAGPRYAIYLSTPEALWAQSMALFQAFTDMFRPAAQPVDCASEVEQGMTL